MQVELVNDGPVTFCPCMSQAGVAAITRESTAMYHLRVPQTEEELERYYQFQLGDCVNRRTSRKGRNGTAGMLAHHQMNGGRRRNEGIAFISMQITRRLSVLWLHILGTG